MRWDRAIVFLAIAASQWAMTQETEEPENTDAVDVSNDQPSLVEGRLELNSKLRTALLKALTDLENEGNRKISEIDNSREENERDIESAQASAVTIFDNESQDASILPQELFTKTSDEDMPRTVQYKLGEDPAHQRAELLIPQKSEPNQSLPITSLEKNPLDPLKDAEQIITSASASNSFASKNEARSTKITGFANLNTISNSELKKPAKASIVEKFSIGKAVKEPVSMKTYIKPLEFDNNSTFGLTSLKTIGNGVAFKSNKNEENSNKENQNEITEVPVEVSTEESEAKVEQVQFFSAPLVAAFTVHQDEKGQPKKVEPIFNNGLGSKKEVSIPSVSQPISQTPTFNNLELQQKQQFLEQELEKVRNQKLDILARNSQHFNSLDSNGHGFKQAINQNFNQLDPVFTEPDRSIVTRLATIDPSSLLAQNSGLDLNRFASQDVIFPRANPTQPNSNLIVAESKPNFQTQTETSADVSLVPSISFDPLVEAGKLPANAQILPNKEPTGFHSFIPFPKPQNQNNLLITGSSSSNFNAFHQPSSTFIKPNSHNVAQPSFNLIRSSDEAGQNFLPDRFLRQEQDTSSLNFNRNTFSIVRAQQPFEPKFEIGSFPDNNGFLRQKETNLASPNQNTRFFRGQSQNVGFVINSNSQNQNRFFKSNVGGNPQKLIIQPSIQPFGPQPLSGNSLGHQYFRSNQEKALGSPQNIGFDQAQKFVQNNRILRSNQEGAFTQVPVLQKYKYSNPFGLPSIPLD